VTGAAITRCAADKSGVLKKSLRPAASTTTAPCGRHHFSAPDDSLSTAQSPPVAPVVAKKSHVILSPFGNSLSLFKSCNLEMMWIESPFHDCHFVNPVRHVRSTYRLLSEVKMSKTIKVIVIDGAEEAREIITPQSGGNQYDGTAADEMVVAGDADDRIHGGGGIPRYTFFPGPVQSGNPGSTGSWWMRISRRSGPTLQPMW